MNDRFAAAALRAALDIVPEPAWIVDETLRLTHFNRPFREAAMQLLDAHPTRGVELTAMIPRRRVLLRRYLRDLGQRALAGRSVSAEATYRMRGARRRFAVDATPIADDDRIAGVFFAARDITDYRRASSHEFLQLALARIVTEDHQDTNHSARLLEAFCESVGWDVGIAWSFDPITGARELSALWSKPTVDGPALLEQLRGGGLRAAEIPDQVWKSKEAVVISDLWDDSSVRRSARMLASGLRSLVAFPVSDSFGAVVGVFQFFARGARPFDQRVAETLEQIGREVGRFIERKQADAERLSLQTLLVKKGREWSLTFDAIDAPILIFDAEGRVTRLNRAARDLANVETYQEILGRHVSTLGTGEPWTTLTSMVDAATRKAERVTTQISDPIHRRTWDASATVSLWGIGEEARTVVILRDITTVIELQASLRRSERLSEMGELVAGVAHEVRNPLFGMSLTLDTWEMLKDDPTSSIDLVPALRKWIDRLNHLMQRLLDFGKAADLVITETPIDEVIAAAVESCSLLAQREHVTIERDLPMTAPIVRMDSSRLVQAFENLITNAIQHSPAGGTIRVKVQETANGRGPAVACAVCDSGPGFANEDLPRIFEPFFTRRRGGVGLGLSIVSRVVEELGGTIAAENQPTGGAAVTLTIPLAYEVQS